MASTYNPYSAINAIYNLKSEWDKHNKSGDIQARDKAAENAKVFYKQLIDNNHSKVANELSSVDVNGAKYILDQYSMKNSGVDNPGYSTSMQGATNKNNTLAGYIDSDRKDVQGKYNDIYNYANQDITKTDEYQSTYNNIMGKYDMSALQGRDKVVASGGASNGGNIDSYSAANAMRQQAALTAQGQKIAHQAGLDAAMARVSNINAILNQLGIYNDSTYSAMNNTINNDLNIARGYFTNAETAKNNEAARQEVYSNISGTVGDTVKKYLNSNTWNADGSLANPNQDYQASINELEKALSSTTNVNERAKIQEQLKVLEAARNQKIDEQGLTYGKTYKYQSATPTLARDQMNVNADVALQTLGVESADKRYVADTEAKIAAGNNATELAKVKSKNNITASQARQAIKDGIITQDVIDAYNTHFGGEFTVENPPKIGDDGDDILLDDGDQSPKEPSEPTEKKYGVDESLVKIGAYDTNKAFKVELGDKGKQAVDKVIKLVANGELGVDGYVSNYELAEWLINNSNANDTNKAQLKKIFSYFGMDTKMLDNVTNAYKMPWNWETGVKTK